MPTKCRLIQQSPPLRPMMASRKSFRIFPSESGQQAHDSGTCPTLR